MFKQAYSLLKRDAKKIFYLIFGFFAVCWLLRVMGTYYLRDLLFGDSILKYAFINTYNTVQIACLGLLILFVTQSKMNRWPAFIIFCVVTLLTRQALFQGNIEFLANYFVGGISGKTGSFAYVLAWSIFFELSLLIFWFYLLFKKGYTQKVLQGLLKILLFYLLGTLWNCFVSSAQCDMIQLLRDTSTSFLWGFVHNPIYGLLWNTIHFVGYVFIMYFLTGWVEYEKERPQNTLTKKGKKRNKVRSSSKI